MAKLASIGVAAALLSGLLLLAACGGDDGGEDPPPATDLGPGDLGSPDVGCPWFPYPNCVDGQFAVQDPPPEGCERGEWHCEACPDPVGFPSCPAGQSHQRDENGCVSPTLCDCSITRAPACREGTVPQYYGEADGKRCLTGACGPDCAAVDPPECGIYEQEERDDRGCLTGGCKPVDCAPREPRDCPCGQRQSYDAAGCLTNQCGPEPDACTVAEPPDCTAGRTPRLTPGGACLAGDCVAGACIDRCQFDWQCASSDVCEVYATGCRACFPKPCKDFRDCPNASDCQAGRCRLREVAECTTNAECADDLLCDSPTCGACEPPCECLDNSQCDRGTRCSDCRCVEGCQDDGDCTLPQRCQPDTGACSECECTTHEECGAGEYCTGCFCRAGCREDTECAPWDYCDPETHQCKPDEQCRRNNQCARGQRCVDTRCIDDPGACAEGGDSCQPAFDACSCDYVCPSPGQEPEACSRDCGDAAATIAPPLCLCGPDGCQLGTCDGASQRGCPAPYHCSKRVPGNPMVEGVCREGRPPARQLCRDDADCVPEDCCAATLCVRADDAACANPMDCGGGECRAPIVGCGCVDGVCVTDYNWDFCPAP